MAFLKCMHAELSVQLFYGVYLAEVLPITIVHYLTRVRLYNPET